MLWVGIWAGGCGLALRCPGRLASDSEPRHAELGTLQGAGPQSSLTGPWSQPLVLLQ